MPVCWSRALLQVDAGPRWVREPRFLTFPFFSTRGEWQQAWGPAQRGSAGTRPRGQ